MQRFYHAKVVWIKMTQTKSSDQNDHLIIYENKT